MKNVIRMIESLALFACVVTIAGVYVFAKIARSGIDRLLNAADHTGRRLDRLLAKRHIDG